MDTTSRLDLPFIMPGQALKHITHNEALQRLDTLVQPVVASTTLTVPPVSPIEGEAYLVPAGATGAWAGHADELAAWQSGNWLFSDPAPGWQVVDAATGTLLIYSGSAWIAVASTGAGLPKLGVNTSADLTNRLAVAGPATLLTHDGAGHQLKLNKAAANHTASLLFQSAWSGHAEMGLMGDNHWRIKVSADGATWTEALAIDAATAGATFAGPLRPAIDNTLSLGSGTARWSAIWSASGTIQTSDRRLKTDVAPTDLGLDFILALEPVRFGWTQSDGRTHYGFIAQAVADAVTRCGARDFGGHVLGDPGDVDSVQALRYDQFVAPLVAAVQALAERIARLEAASAA